MTAARKVAPLPADEEQRRSEVLERLALTLESAGFPRSMARIFSALTLAEGEGLSTGELVESLGVSKASITNSMHLLLGFDLVQRYRVRGSRQAHYRVLKDKWGAIMTRKWAAIGEVRRSAEEALDFTDSPAARERLEEMRDVYSFFERELSDVTNRWNMRHEEER